MDRPSKPLQLWRIVNGLRGPLVAFCAESVDRVLVAV